MLNAPRFPIHKVPNLPFEKIVSHLDLVEIVDLSSLSSKLCSFVTSCRLKTSKFHDLELDLDYDPRRSNEYQGNLVVYQVPFSEVPNDSSKKSIILTRRGCEIQIDPTKIHVEIVTIQKNETKVQDFLKTDYITLKIFPLNEFFRPSKRHVDTVVVPDSTVPMSYHITAMIMNNLSIRKLSVSRKINPRYCFSGFLTIEQVFLLDADWLHTDVLLDMSCKVISIENETLSVETLNKIISCWKKGGLRNLERFSMSMDVEGKRGEFKKERVMKGLQTMHWKREHRPMCFGTKDCSNAVDIRRSDGMLATILFDYDGFNFLVWHESYLNDK